MFNPYDADSSLSSGVDEYDPRASGGDDGLDHELKEKQQQVQQRNLQEAPRSQAGETSAV